MPIDHAVVWLGFRTAKVFLFEDIATLSGAEEPKFIYDKHPMLGHDGQREQRSDCDFFEDILRVIGTTKKWMIIGNRSNCLGLLTRICRQKTDDRVVGVVAVDASSDEEVLSRVRSYFGDRH
ncbi:hypothetical protein FJ546_28895 [Mesorhizobium sp. B2-4-19]|uniref:hypothetical protein n=1 Tax=Mesorhizobium sp. B2-4-19 TaxID=2589930 RepID=UPI00112DC051|nr:hypothetical protein [Mesorhizobium sp. B2-4-19]TPK55839.1 hypothetical protein FJ546_28895 [Mesorhizobium sp. B2-4-19]